MADDTNIPSATSMHAPLSQLPDEALASRAQSGSSPCFVELIGRFESRIYNFILRRVCAPADAEDLTQETFLLAWRNLARYRPTNRFSTWLFTIASRLAIDSLRAAARSRRKLEDRAYLVQAIANDPVHDDTSHHAGSELWALAARVLSSEQHAALWLRYAEDMPIPHIAIALGRTRISVRVMLHRARETLAAHATPAISGPPAAVKPDLLTGGVSCPCQ